MRRAFPQEKWSSYLDEAEEAMAGAGIDKNCPGVKKFLNRLLGMPVQFEVAEEEILAQLLVHQYPMKGVAKGEGSGILDGSVFGALFGRKAA